MSKSKVRPENPPASEDIEAVEGDESNESVAAEEKNGESITVEEMMQNLEKENEALRDQILRVRADGENYRKRMSKLRQDDYKYRHQDILRDLAEVIDNFERAIQSSEEARDYDGFHEGIQMIEKQFTGMLKEKFGLERFGEPGEAFDPNFHEAMMMEETDDVDKDTVVQVFQSGYRLHDRTLRAAKVKVARAVNPIEEADRGTDESTEGTENDSSAENKDSQ